MVRMYISGGDVVRQRRAASMPAEDLSPVYNTTSSNKAYLISNHAVQDSEDLTAASRRNDRNFLQDISNKLASANAPRPVFRETTPVYIGSKYPAPSGHQTLADCRRRTSYVAPPVSDYEVSTYMVGGPTRSFSRTLRGGSVPPLVPPSAPSVPKWHVSPRSRGSSVSRASPGPRGVPHATSQSYTPESLQPYEDVVVGVAHTSLYGDIVIGIPYNKRHMFEQDNNHIGASTYKPTAASRHSLATHPSSGSAVKSDYRRTSYASPRRSVSLYDHDDDEIISKPSRYVARKRYDDLEDEIDWPSTKPTVTSLRGRAQSAQRQLNGIPEFQMHGSPTFRASSIGPGAVPSSPAAGRSYSGMPSSSAGSSYGTSSYNGAASRPPTGFSGSANTGLPKQLPRAPKPPMSEARRKVRDLLCKSKNDPRYFED